MFWSLGLYAQMGGVFLDARSAALGGATAVAAGGIWTGNPSVWEEESRRFVRLQMALPYGLASLRAVGIAGGHTVGFSHWQFGLLAERQGVVYRHHSWMLSYGRLLQEGWAVGVRFVYGRARYEGYAARGDWSLVMGLQWAVDEAWTFACRWSPYVRGEERFADLALGVRHRLSRQFLLLLELQQAVDDFLPVWRIGAAYCPVEELSIQLGLSRLARAEAAGGGRILRIHVGCRYVFGFWNTHAALVYHPYLGFTPILNLQRQIQKLW